MSDSTFIEAPPTYGERDTAMEFYGKVKTDVIGKENPTRQDARLMLLAFSATLHALANEIDEGARKDELNVSPEETIERIDYALDEVAKMECEYISPFIYFPQKEV